MLEKPHKKLDVWQKSIVLTQKIYELTRGLPDIENYGLTNQMRREARHTKKEFIQFLHMAQSPLSELDTNLEICHKLGYLKENSVQNLFLLMNDIDKMLTGLIKSLRK